MEVQISKATGIYKITNMITNEMYIGSAASSFTKRWHRHKKDLKMNNHSNHKMQNSYNKYGEQSFSYEIIELCKKEDCVKREQFYIDTFNPHFNILRIAGSALGHIVPIETRIQISNTMKNMQFSNEHRKNLSLSATGNKNGKFNRGKTKPPVKDSTRMKLSIKAKEQWIKQKERVFI